MTTPDNPFACKHGNHEKTCKACIMRTKLICHHGRSKRQCNECDLEQEVKELKYQLKIRDDLSCKTCKGAGTVMIAIDDGIDCPECVERDNKIKAEAVMDLVNEQAFSAVVDGVAITVIDADGAINYADNLKGGK